MSLNSNRRPSDATPPRPKKRKIAIAGGFPSGSAAASSAGISHLPTPSRATFLAPDSAIRTSSDDPTEDSLRNGPVSTHSTHTPASPSRMLATPARSRELAQTQTPKVRPITANQRLNATKVAPLASRSKAQPSFSVNAKSSVGAGTRKRMIPRGPIASPHSKMPRVGAPAWTRQEDDLLAFASEWSSTEADSGSEENGSFRPIVTLVPVREPPGGLRRARKAFNQAAAKTAWRKLPELVRRDQTPLDLANEDPPPQSDSDDDLYVESNPNHSGYPAKPDDASSNVTTTTKHVDTTPEQELVEALNTLPLNLHEAALHASRQLPFLRRNVRRSLDILGAQKAGERFSTPSAIPESYPKVRVEYTVGGRPFVGYSIHGWRCPVCRMLRTMPFATRAGLELHLTRYHKHCVFSFADDARDASLVLHIKLPEVPDSDSESEADEEDDFSDSSESEKEIIRSPNSTDQLSAFHRSPTPEQKPFLRGTSVVGGRRPFAPSPVKSPRDSPSPPPFSVRARALRTKRSASPSSNPVSVVVQRPPRPTDPENPARYPTPPPLTNLEGPAAVYPFLTDGAYSARPGGPRLYDLLNELPLASFGLMAWYVLDREEDIFELDDVCDEDKVMRALWGRWIMLNRYAFTANYEKGAKMFIDEYWRMIHRAAGFSALRIFLLTLVQNRFLTGTQFCGLLKYYSDLVGMDLWK